MNDERDQRRYFGGLLFFIGVDEAAAQAGSYLLLFAGWEGVGLASYVLIGYHFERPRAAEAATKAFIVNRIGDAGLILAIIALALSCGSTNFAAVAAACPRVICHRNRRADRVAAGHRRHRQIGAVSAAYLAA